MAIVILLALVREGSMNIARICIWTKVGLTDRGERLLPVIRWLEQRCLIWSEIMHITPLGTVTPEGERRYFLGAKPAPPCRWTPHRLKRFLDKLRDEETSTDDDECAPCPCCGDSGFAGNPCPRCWGAERWVR